MRCLNYTYVWSALFAETGIENTLASQAAPRRGNGRVMKVIWLAQITLTYLIYDYMIVTQYY